MIKLTTAVNAHQYTVYWTSARADGRSAIMVESMFVPAESAFTKADAEKVLRTGYDDPSIEVRDIV